MTEDKEKGKRLSSPISLKPYQFDEAVSDMLKVKPESKQKETKMPRFKVIYRCPKCGHEDFSIDNYSSKSAAMGTASAPCPHHEELGDLQATDAIEVKGIQLEKKRRE
jgi:hypothetical protein